MSEKTRRYKDPADPNEGEWTAARVTRQPQTAYQLINAQAAIIERLQSERNQLHVLVVDKLLLRHGSTGDSFKCSSCGEVDMHCVPCPVGAALGGDNE